MPNNIHAIIVEDSILISKMYAKELEKHGLSAAYIHCYKNYHAAREGINALNADAHLFVLLDRDLGGNSNESGVELYFDLLEKFQKPYIVSISSDPASFEEAITSDDRSVELNQDSPVFRGIVYEKKTTDISKYLQLANDQIDSLTLPTKGRDTLSISFNTNFMYSQQTCRVEPLGAASFVVAKTSKSYCTIS